MKTNLKLTDQKTNVGLAEFVREWVGQACWYGSCCNQCTSGLLSIKAAEYPSMYAPSRMPRYQKDIEEGKSCADCVGLIKGYHWTKDGKVTYDKNTDVDATKLLRLAKVKGPVQTIPEVPGLVLYKPGHAGIYEGDGNVIEAKGFKYGVIRSKIEDTRWTDWFADPLISYAGYEDMLTQNTPEMPYTALVVTKTTPLNIWSNTQKTNSLFEVQKGDTLTVTGNASTGGWFIVEKDGIKGFADGRYLEYKKQVIRSGIDTASWHEPAGTAILEESGSMAPLDCFAAACDDGAGRSGDRAKVLDKYL